MERICYDRQIPGQQRLCALPLLYTSGYTRRPGTGPGSGGGRDCQHGEDWQASQAWARLVQVTTYSDNQDSPPTTTEAVELSVEAVNTQGGRRTFTQVDYPEFVITDPAAVAFFKYFTNNNIII